MKKLFAIVAMAAMLFACGEKPEGGNNNNGNSEEPVFESLITVDGDFSDWAGLDASKVSVATRPDGAVKHDGLVCVKAYADELYLNVYFEFDEIVIANRNSAPFHVYLNADGDETTGGGDALWAPYCAEWMLEGNIFDGAGGFGSWDPGVFPWGGEPNTSGWEWHPVGVPADAEHNWGAIITEGNGVASGAGAGNAYEIQIMREMVPATWADTFTCGFDIQQDWTTVGALPILNATDENPEGATTMMVVTIDK